MDFASASQLTVTPLYAGFFALLYFGLSIWVIALRRRLWISLGNGDSEALLRRRRVHGNFAEYVPLTLLLLVILDLQGLYPVALHALALCLLFGRLAHILGIGRAQDHFTLRTIGMVLTFISMSMAGLIAIGLSLSGYFLG